MAAETNSMDKAVARHRDEYNKNMPNGMQEFGSLSHAVAFDTDQITGLVVNLGSTSGVKQLFYGINKMDTTHFERFKERYDVVHKTISSCLESAGYMPVVTHGDLFFMRSLESTMHVHRLDYLGALYDDLVFIGSTKEPPESTMLVKNLDYLGALYGDLFFMRSTKEPPESTMLVKKCASLQRLKFLKDDDEGDEININANERFHILEGKNVKCLKLGSCSTFLVGFFKYTFATSGTSQSETGQTSGTSQSETGQTSGTSHSETGQTSGTSQSETGQTSSTSQSGTGQAFGTSQSGTGQASSTSQSGTGKASCTSKSRTGQASSTSQSATRNTFNMHRSGQIGIAYGKNVELSTTCLKFGNILTDFKIGSESLEMKPKVLKDALINFVEKLLDPIFISFLLIIAKFALFG